jgi:hypothetical protein
MPFVEVSGRRIHYRIQCAGLVDLSAADLSNIEAADAINAVVLGFPLG